MTRVAVLTPPGRGAIAVVAVAGPEATRLVDRCFAAANGRPLGEQPIGAIRFGRWRSSEQDPTGDQPAAGEEVIVVRTAADRVEIHCHGGAAASAAIVGSLVENGATATAPRDLEPPADRSPLAADAWRLVAEAPTERAAAVLLDQAAGALDRNIESVLASLEAERLSEAAAALDLLLRHRRLGERLITPWRVVLAGPPNAGKSSLVNALVGYQRAIVYDRPGTTRDVVTADTAVAGWPVTLADTAGLRESDDAIEAAGVRLARRVLATADAVVIVQEAATIDSAAAARFRDELAAQLTAPSIQIASKADLLADPQRVAAPRIGTSVGREDRRGVDALLAAIERTLGIGSPPAGAAVPFRPWHAERIEAAHAAALSRDGRSAAHALRALLAGGAPVRQQLRTDCDDQGD